MPLALEHRLVGADLVLELLALRHTVLERDDLFAPLLPERLQLCLRRLLLLRIEGEDHVGVAARRLTDQLRLERRKPLRRLEQRWIGRSAAAALAQLALQVHILSAQLVMLEGLQQHLRPVSAAQVAQHKRDKSK